MTQTKGKTHQLKETGYIQLQCMNYFDLDSELTVKMFVRHLNTDWISDTVQESLKFLRCNHGIVVMVF